MILIFVCVIIECEETVDLDLPVDLTVRLITELGVILCPSISYTESSEFSLRNLYTAVSIAVSLRGGYVDLLMQLFNDASSFSLARGTGSTRPGQSG